MGEPKPVRARPFKFAGRADYFAVNDRVAGYRTSFRVSGRLGELGRRFCMFDDAASEAKRLNRAYNLGYEHGVRASRPLSETER
jgi:hypothetical protein